MKAVALLLGACLAAAPPAAKVRYQPDLTQWRLELGSDLGGWLTNPKVPFTLKVVDPRDPDPPKEVAGAYGYEEQYEDWAGLYGNLSDLTPKQRMARIREIQAEEEAKNGWRRRQVRIWFNGEDRSAEVRVGNTYTCDLECLNGENRLEVFEPTSGLRAVRTWWTASGTTRLRINQVRSGEENGFGGLEVVEPNGDLGENWRRTPSGGVVGWNSYTHANPPSGTYTLRWQGGHRQEGSPCTIVVEAVLDPGTEQEKRWRFSRLLLPGAGPAILGTLDVED